MTNEEQIMQLDPQFAALVHRFIPEARVRFGYQLRIVSGKRTPQEQEVLYAQGRTRPGRVVTYVRGIGPNIGLHVLGRAIDVTEVTKGYAISFVSLGALWKQLGGIKARWGGDFPGFPDLSHFELIGGTMTETKPWYATADPQFISKHVEAVRVVHLGLYARDPDVPHWQISPDLHEVTKSLLRGGIGSGELAQKLPEFEIKLT